MNKSIRYRSLYANALMAGSLALLLGFLAYWNIENYQRQYDELHKELEYQAKLATAEINENNLIRFISTIKNDSTEYQISAQYFEENDSLKYSKLSSGVRFNMDSIGISIDSTFTFNPNADCFPPDHDWKHDTLIIFERDEFPTGLKHDIANMNDMIKLQKYHASPEVLAKFNERLDSSELPTDYLMEDENPPGQLAIAFNQRFDQKSWAIFQDYKKYLFKKILPSFLASVGLFILVGLSFYTLFNSRQQQLRLNQIKNEFVANMTHELKTPISTVSVALEAISDFGAKDDPERMNEYLDISKHELNRLTLLVDKVLKMSAFDKGGTTLKLEKLDLNVIINDILKSMKLHFENHQVALSYEIEGTDFEINGDRIHLTNVIYNLLDNAIKYSKVRPQIHLKLKHVADQIIVSIKDQGIGISKAYLDKIFNRFFRVPNLDKHDVKGHGLGLSYVRQIVEAHGGQINVESEANEGSCFTIEIPIQVAHA